jgi:hypothetical protein
MGCVVLLNIEAAWVIFWWGKHPTSLKHFPHELLIQVVQGSATLWNRVGMVCSGFQEIAGHYGLLPLDK